MEEVPSEVGSGGSMITLILVGRKEEKHSFSKGFGGLLAPQIFQTFLQTWA